VTLWSTKLLTEMSIKNLPGGEGRPERKAENLTRHMWADWLENVGASASHNPMDSRACYRDSFAFYL
jgi:hypothetical protein